MGVVYGYLLSYIYIYIYIYIYDDDDDDVDDDDETCFNVFGIEAFSI